MTNADIATVVNDTQALWSGVRLAEPMQQIRRIMREKGIKNIDLAERLSVSAASLSRTLRGTKNLRIETLYRIADALEVPLTIAFDVPGTPDEAYQEGREDALFELSKQVANANPDKLLAAIKRTVEGGV